MLPRIVVLATMVALSITPVVFTVPVVENTVVLSVVVAASGSVVILPSTAVVSSVRSSSGYHGLIEIQRAATFSDFSNSSDSKVKVKVKGPNSAIFLKSMGFKDIEYDIPVYQM